MKLLFLFIFITDTWVGSLQETHTYDIARESSYPTPLAQSAYLQPMVESLSRQKNSPTPTQTPDTIKDEYDYIIVGAGSAGSTVAGRLTEEPCVSVLILEAGRNAPLLNDIPIYGTLFWFTDLDWAYKTVPQKHAAFNLKNKQLTWPSGKGLGGSSLLNDHLYVRGNTNNYDDWAKQGATGWSYQDVLPYFIKMENNSNTWYTDNGYHGTSGPLNVESIRYAPKLKDKVLDGTSELGYKVVDPNAGRQTGIYDPQIAARDAQRCSAAKAYLVPAEDRKNLDILPNAFVQKIIIENKQAVGVKFDVNGTMHQVRAKKEVIVSAGTVNSAQLLILSGIGPKEELEKHKIPVVADLPVGKNLQDHCTSLNIFTLDESQIPSLGKLSSSNESYEQYINHRTGPLTSPEGVVAMAFLKDDDVKPEVDDPNYQLYFIPFDVAAFKTIGVTDETFNQTYLPYSNNSVFACNSQILLPKSRGTVTLQSADPHDSPLINPNYYAEPQDLEDVVEGVKTCHRHAKTQAMKSIGTKYIETVYPGCEKYEKFSDDFYRCHVLAVLFTQSHQVGTAKMGDPKDPTTVVDPELRVKGIKGLRVIDASVMPTVTSGNTNIPTIMIGEKASDIIKGGIQCKKSM